MSYQIEKNILWGVTTNIQIFSDFVGSDLVSLFSSNENKKLAKLICDFIKTYDTLPTKEALFQEYQFSHQDQELLSEFFDEFEDQAYDLNNLKYHTQKLKDSYTDKSINDLSEIINDDNFVRESKIENIKKVLSNIEALSKEQEYAKSTARDFIPEFKQDYINKIKNPDIGVGILTGYSYFDYINNGLREDDLLLIAGETGSGKSMMLSNLATQIWMQKNTINLPTENFTKGYNIVYFSLEMGFKGCFRRFMAKLADVPTYGLRDSKLNKYEAKAVSTACKFIERYPYEFEIIDVPRGFTVAQLEYHYKNVLQKYKPDVIFIDYLGLMEDVASSDEVDWLKLGILTGKIHEFARAYKTPICSAVQLNRHDKRSPAIGTHRVGRSSIIPQHASIMIQLEFRENEQYLPDTIYHLIKNRDSELGHAKLTKNFAHASLLDVPYDFDSHNSFNANSNDISEEMAEIVANIIKGD